MKSRQLPQGKKSVGLELPHVASISRDYVTGTKQAHLNEWASGAVTSKLAITVGKKRGPFRLRSNDTVDKTGEVKFQANSCQY